MQRFTLEVFTEGNTDIVNLHADPARRLRELKDLTKLTWNPPEGKTASEIGAAIQKDLQVKAPMNCQSCHR